MCSLLNIASHHILASLLCAPGMSLQAYHRAVAATKYTEEFIMVCASHVTGQDLVDPAAAKKM